MQVQLLQESATFFFLFIILSEKLRSRSSLLSTWETAWEALSYFGFPSTKHTHWYTGASPVNTQKQLRMKHTMFKEKLKNWVCSVLHKILRAWGKRHRDLCCLQYPRRKYRENADTPLLNILSEGKKAQDNGQKIQHRKFWLRVKKKKIPIKVFKQDVWMVWNSSTGDNQNLAGQAHKQASYHWFEQEKEFLV